MRTCALRYFLPALLIVAVAATARGGEEEEGKSSPVALDVGTDASQLASADVQNCWVSAGERYRVDPWLLWCIAKKESRFNPYAINRNTDGTFDIGTMQINSSHFVKLKKYGIEPSHLYDACTNINVGAWVLSHSIRAMGNNWGAVGAYNAGVRKTKQQELKRARYAADVRNCYNSTVGMQSAHP